LVSKLRQGATTQLNNQKERATEGIGSVVQAVRQSSRQLRQEHHETIAGYVEQAADQIDRFSQRLRDRDVTQLIGDVQRFSRRQPAAFVSGAFALGLIAARFLKSSARDERREWNQSSRSSAPGRDEHGYQRAADARSYTAHDVSRARNYGSSPALDREPGASITTSRPGVEGSGRTTGAGSGKSSRGPQTERS
jgi:hypothetical protein